MLKYARGARITHTHYGDGTLQSVNQYHTVIDFDVHGVRKFSSPRVVLAPSATPPPVRPTSRPRQPKRPPVKPS
jgi:hypothetical protein